MKILALKSEITKMKNSLDRLNSWFERAKGRISEPQDSFINGNYPIQ